MKLIEGLAQIFSLKLLKSGRVVFGILSILGLISPIPLFDMLLFAFFFIICHLAIKQKESQIQEALCPDHHKLRKDIDNCLKSLNDYIRDNNIGEYDFQIPVQIKEIESIVNENFEIVGLSTERLQQLKFNPGKYEEKRKDILNSLEADISQKERKYLEETLNNLLEYKSGVQRLMTKRREIIAVIENLYYQLKALHVKLLNQGVNIKKEGPYKKLKNEIDEIIKSVEDIEKAKKETDRLIDDIHEVI